jgi:hypothetical protein
MQFPLLVKILQTLQEFSNEDSDIIFTEYTSFHLVISSRAHEGKLTKSATDPPEQNSMTIHKSVPFKYEP